MLRNDSGISGSGTVSAAAAASSDIASSTTQSVDVASVLLFGASLSRLLSHWFTTDCDVAGDGV